MLQQASQTARKPSELKAAHIVHFHVRTFTWWFQNGSVWEALFARTSAASGSVFTVAGGWSLFPLSYFLSTYSKSPNILNANQNQCFESCPTFFFFCTKTIFHFKLLSGPLIHRLWFKSALFKIFKTISGKTEGNFILKGLCRCMVKFIGLFYKIRD